MITVNGELEKVIQINQCLTDTVDYNKQSNSKDKKRSIEHSEGSEKNNTSNEDPVLNSCDDINDNHATDQNNGYMLIKVMIRSL